MVASGVKLKVRELRKQGNSIKKISQVLNIPQSSIRGWVKDILLTPNQIELLRQSELRGKALGRLKSVLLLKNERLRRMDKAKEEGIHEISQLNQRELLLCGAALYWGEGNKKSRRTEFFNSDPKMIQFFITWLTKCMGIKIEDLYCRVGINEIHQPREEEIKTYWVNITGVEITQFRKTSFKKVKNQKIYQNHNQHYGTLTVGVVKSTDLSYKILGLIDGLSIGSVAQLVRASES